MSGQHTSGRLEFRISHTEPEAYDLTAVGVGAMALVKSEANARRLGACWNLLRSFPTEQIEAGEIDLVKLAEERDQLRGECIHLRAKCETVEGCANYRTSQADTARSLLSEVLASIPDDHSDPLVDRIRGLLGPAGGEVAVRTVEDMVERLVDYAAAVHVVVTVWQKPRLPLAMGNYDTVFEVRPARGYY